MSDTVKNTAEVALTNGLIWVHAGDMEINVGEDGALSVWDYQPPRDGNGLVFAAPKGEWRMAIIKPLTIVTNTKT
jgi:hypothetical protein